MDALVALEKVKPDPSNKYTVLVYFLNATETIEETNVHGGIIVMGAYANKELAIEASRKIIKKTGHRQVMIVKTCEWHFMKPESFRDSKVIPAERDKMFLGEAMTSAGLDLKTQKSVTSPETRDVLFEQYKAMQNPDDIESYRYRQQNLKHLIEKWTETESKINKLKTEISHQLDEHPEFKEPV